MSTTYASDGFGLEMFYEVPMVSKLKKYLFIML